MSTIEGLYNRILIFSFIALWLSIQLTDEAEHIIAYILILTVGIGHGANDLKIYFKTQQLNFKKSLLFIGTYAAVVGIGFALFFVVPEIILVLFLIGSGYHFGQEHFEKYGLSDSLWKVGLMTTYGLSIILCILYVNNKESLLILNDLITVDITVQFLLISWITISTLTLVMGIVALKNLQWGLIARELLYLVVLYVLFVSSSLIWSFAIYFVLWHSIPSIHHQIGHLYGEANMNNTVKYLKSSIWYWIAALLFLGMLYYFLHLDKKLFLSILVAFLGGITFPHVIVMNRLHK